MSKPAQQTSMECRECGAKVWIEDGAYSCECWEIGLWQVNEMGMEFPKFWVDIETEEPQEPQP